MIARPDRPGAPIVVRCQPELLAKIDRLRKELGVTRPELLRLAVIAMKETGRG